VAAIQAAAESSASGDTSGGEGEAAVAMVMDNFINLPLLSVVHSLASFLMWLKLLYFMRIFKDTGKPLKIDIIILML
jgi:hypothetical protein